MPSKLLAASNVSTKQSRIDKAFDINKASIGTNKTLGIEEHRLPENYNGESKFEYLYSGIPVFVNADSQNRSDSFKVITEKAEKFAIESEKLNYRIKTLGKKLTDLGDSFVMQSIGKLSNYLFSFKEPGKPLTITDTNVINFGKIIQNVYSWEGPESLHYALYLSHFSSLPSIIKNLPEKSLDRSMGVLKLGIMGTYARLHVHIETKIKDPAFDFGNPKEIGGEKVGPGTTEKPSGSGTGPGPDGEF